MNKSLKMLLLGIVSFGIMSLHAGDNRGSIVIGNGNKLLGGINQGSGTSQIRIGNNSIVGNIATEDGFVIFTDDKAVTISSKKVVYPCDAPTKTIRLTGLKKEMSLEGVVGNNRSIFFEHVVKFEETEYLKNQIMLCDQAVIEAGLLFGVKNGKLVPKLPKNTTIRFEGANKDKPLCVITQMLQNTRRNLL